MSSFSSSNNNDKNDKNNSSSTMKALNWPPLKPGEYNVIIPKNKPGERDPFITHTQETPYGSDVYRDPFITHTQETTHGSGVYRDPFITHTQETSHGSGVYRDPFITHTQETSHGSGVYRDPFITHTQETSHGSGVYRDPFITHTQETSHGSGVYRDPFITHTQETSHGSGVYRDPFITHTQETTHGSGVYRDPFITHTQETSNGSGVYRDPFITHTQETSYGSGVYRNPFITHTQETSYGSGVYRDPFITHTQETSHGSGVYRDPFITHTQETTHGSGVYHTTTYNTGGLYNDENVKIFRNENDLMIYREDRRIDGLSSSEEVEQVFEALRDQEDRQGFVRFRMLDHTFDSKTPTEKVASWDQQPKKHKKAARKLEKELQRLENIRSFHLENAALAEEAAIGFKKKAAEEMEKVLRVFQTENLDDDDDDDDDDDEQEIDQVRRKAPFRMHPSSRWGSVRGSRGPHAVSGIDSSLRLIEQLQQQAETLFSSDITPPFVDTTTILETADALRPNRAATFPEMPSGGTFSNSSDPSSSRVTDTTTDTSVTTTRATAGIKLDESQPSGGSHQNRSVSTTAIKSEPPQSSVSRPKRPFAPIKVKREKRAIPKIKVEPRASQEEVESTFPLTTASSDVGKTSDNDMAPSSNTYDNDGGRGLSFLKKRAIAARLQLARVKRERR